MTVRMCMCIVIALLSALGQLCGEGVGPLEIQADFTGHTYYVSPSGDNGNTGLSEAEALATLKYAIEEKTRTDLNNGHDVKILLLPGVYYEGQIILNAENGKNSLNAEGVQASLVIEGTGDIGGVKVSGGRIHSTSAWTLVDSAKNIWSLDWDRDWGFHAGLYDTEDVITKRRELVCIVDPTSGDEKMLKPVIIENVSYNTSTEVYTWDSYSDPRAVLQEWQFGVADFGPGDTINGISYSSNMHNAGGGTADDDKIFIRLPDNLTLDNGVRAGAEVASGGITLSEIEELLLIEKSNLEIRNIVFQHCASRNQQSGRWHNVAIRIGGGWDGVIDRNILLEDILCYRSAGAGLSVRDCEDVLVRNVDWKDNGSRAGGITSINRAWVEDVDVDNNNWRGGPVEFTVHSTGGIGISGIDHTYVNSTFTNNGGMGWRQDIHSENFVIEGCSFNNNYFKSGVEMEATPIGPLRFTDCEFNRNKEAGVFMLTVCNTTFEHCELKDNERAQVLLAFMDRPDVPIMADEAVNDHFNHSLIMVSTDGANIYDHKSEQGDHQAYDIFVQNGFHGMYNRYWNSYDARTEVFCDHGAFFPGNKTYADLAGWKEFVRLNFPDNEIGSTWGDPADQTEQSPTIEPGQSFTIREFLPNKAIVGKVLADDERAGRYDFTFSIESGNTGAAFSIGPSGYLRVNNSAQLVSGNSFSLTIKVVDPSGLSDTETITIHVVSNVAPIGYDETFTIEETASNGDDVGRVSFVDPGDMETLTYSIESGNDDGVFTIDSATGMITIANNSRLLDSYSHSLTVRAIDGGGLSDDAVITIIVASDNDAPVILAGQEFTVAEDATTGTVIGTVSANDPNGDNISFSLSGDDGGFGVFAIDADSGELSVTNDSLLDYCTTPEYELIVTATDDNTPTLSASKTVLIKVTEVVNAGGSVQLTATTASVNEDAGTVTLSVTRTGGSDGAASVDFATSNGTATAGQDYTAAGSTLNWSSGDSGTKDIVIDITNDNNDESDETFTVTLNSATGATLGSDTVATVTIVDNDDAGEVALSVSSVNVEEDAGTVSIDVTRTGDDDGAISVDYATSDDTASAGSDYTAVDATLNWANNDSATKTITIDITDDAVTEGDESFTLTLTNATNGATIGTATATITINANDQYGTITLPVTAADVNEDAGTISVTVERNGGSEAEVSVYYETVHVDTDNGDYTAAGGTLTWAEGNADDKTIEIAITDDNDTEGDEDFRVELSSPTGGATIGNDTETITILANDSVNGVIGLSVATVAVDENAGTVTLTVSRTGGSDGAVSVDYATADDAATAGADYTAVSGTLDWTDGNADDQTIEITITDDSDYEGDETFTVNLSNISGGAVYGTQETVVTIVEDDPEPNHDPIITDGPNADPTTITIPAGIALDVTAIDAAGDTLSYSWSKQSGPGSVAFSAQAVSTTATFNAAGDYTIKVVVSDGNGGSASGSVDVTVEAAPVTGEGDIVVTGNTDFGATYVEDGSSVRTFTIKNEGTGVLLIEDVTLGGTDMTAFSITADPALSIAVGGTTAVEVTFDPASEGSKAATLTIQSDDPTDGTVVLNLTGEALAGSTPAVPPPSDDDDGCSVGFAGSSAWILAMLILAVASRGLALRRRV